LEGHLRHPSGRAAHSVLIQSDGNHYELFNLKNDPYEQTDLAVTQAGKGKLV